MCGLYCSNAAFVVRVQDIAHASVHSYPHERDSMFFLCIDFLRMMRHPRRISLSSGVVCAAYTHSARYQISQVTQPQAGQTDPNLKEAWICLPRACLEATGSGSPRKLLVVSVTRWGKCELDY